MAFWNFQAVLYFFLCLLAFLLLSLCCWNNHFFAYSWSLVLGSRGSYLIPVGAFPHLLLLVSHLHFILFDLFCLL